MMPLWVPELVNVPNNVRSADFDPQNTQTRDHFSMS